MNRQVPVQYALVGDGRVARHMARYFEQMGLAHQRWWRSAPGASTDSLQRAVRDADHVLLLISDDAIADFIEHNPFLKRHSLLHFSGALNLPGVRGCHPLMTFAHSPYALSEYRSMPFVVDTQLDFERVFPALDNPVIRLDPALRPLYHSLCVVAGNFAHTLWREVGEQMEHTLGIDHRHLLPYIQRTLINYIEDPAHSATGPLVRGDVQTIDKHLQVLKDNRLEPIYRSFVDLAKPERSA